MLGGRRVIFFKKIYFLLIVFNLKIILEEVIFREDREF